MTAQPVLPPQTQPDAEVALREAREAAVALVESLRREHEDITNSGQDTNTDDEHDPDGTTVAYEKAKTNALLEQAEANVAEIDAALERLADGSYGRCQSCEQAIGVARLEALPMTPICVSCAAASE
jgi:DnaK suppressor protein